MNEDQRKILEHATSNKMIAAETFLLTERAEAIRAALAEIDRLKAENDRLKIQGNEMDLWSDRLLKQLEDK